MSNMNHRYLSLSLLLLLACVLIEPGPSLAQQPSPPLVLQVSGDYWVWNNPQSSLQQRTNWGHNQDPILSPSGQFIAYKATAQLAVDAMTRKGSSNASILPVNTWVL